MIVFDTTTMSLAFVPGSTVTDRSTNKPVLHAKERIDLLIETLAQNKTQIIIPTPVLSELLVKLPGEKTDELLKQLRSSPWFLIEAFDSAAAVEVGQRTAKAIAGGDKREGLTADWTKVKFDRQIVAIALVAGATEIISDDGDVRAIGERWGIKVSSIKDLPLPSALIPPPLLEHLYLDGPAEVEAKIPEASQSQKESV
jgi:predicted nucleic acid-binding protein